MTTTAHNTDLSVTDGADVRVRVRGTENPRVVPIRPDLKAPSAYTHAIPRSPKEINTSGPSKVRNFVSQHAGDANAALADNWLANGQPRPLGDVWQLELSPTGLTAGLFRAAVYTIAYLACFAVDTNKRAAVTAALLTLSIAAAWAIAAFAH